jgi:hypothetical protein
MKPRREGAVSDEAELRLDARGDERRRLVERDGGDPGPLLAGDEVQDAHGGVVGNLLSVFSLWPASEN